MRLFCVFLLIFNLLFSIFSLDLKDKAGSKQVTSKNLELLFLVEPDSKSQLRFSQENHLKTYTIFYQQFFVKDEKFNEDMLRKQIEVKLPDVNSTGFAVLDWEGKGLKSFQQQKDLKAVDYYKGEFLKAIKFAKKLRPNVKWGFYHLNYLDYSGTIEKYKLQNDNLIPIIKEVDFLAPSLYVYNPGLLHNRGNQNYIKNKLIQALQYGERYNKPVYPFVWNRTTSKDEDKHFSLIPVEYFAQVIEIISETGYKDQKAKGIFWWHSEGYSYRNKNKLQAVKLEYSRINNTEDYQYQMFKEYFQSIKQYIKQN
ncbi:hypothetical protein EGI16_13570 [Chryseobacterium sp. G0240]|uniref:hypothetical protein n=1 Tax=Chryseobacterium sp. G0240 TaxID=2487066 RepID=UPI000F44C7DD|nr:hypothetical protein [Chryseobacterium sp. G0240]ROI02646.1 hypothetical protein EGI16_13570 [Chryseobacterium sp. G0240]